METTKYKSNTLQKAGITLLTILQFIPLAIGWISYALGSVLASLFTWISFVSLLWYPVDWLNKWVWIALEVLKQKLRAQVVDWSYASKCWDRNFPAF